MGVSMEITPRKLAEEQLRQLAPFPEENPNPVFRVSSDGRSSMPIGPPPNLDMQVPAMDEPGAK